MFQDLTENIESLTVERVEENLEAISDSCNQLSGALKRETERRQGSQTELGAVLPPDVLAILSENDPEEKLNEEALHTNYNKLVDTVRTFVRKLQLEDTRKEERLLEVVDSNDPVATAAAKEAVLLRYQQAYKKIQSELLSHLENKIESSDVNIATLEHFRGISEILTAESRELLRGSSIVAGDYEVVAAGVYGDDIQMSSQSELIPLLKQLIALLDSGINFQLAPEMLTALQQTQTSQQQAKVLQMIQAATLQQQQQLQAQKAQPGVAVGQQGTSGILQISPESYKPVYGPNGEMISQPEYSRTRNDPKRKRVSIQEQVLIRDGDRTVGEIAAESTPGQESDTKGDSIRKILMMRRMSSRRLLDSAAAEQRESAAEARDMMERHALEIAQLENELRSEEINKINEILSDIEERKKTEIAKLKSELKEKLKLCKTEEEKQQVMLEYAGKIRDVAESLEKEKQRRLAELRKNLAEERRRRKKALFEKQKAEAEKAGLDPAKIVTDITSENQEEVNKDLLLLAQQQEKLIAELQKAYEDEDGEDTEEKKKRLDEEMEARIRALNASRASSLMSNDEINDLMESGKRDNARISNLRANMKDKMKMRRDKRRSSRRDSLLAEGSGTSDLLNPEEAEMFNAKARELELAESERLEAAVLLAMEEVEWEASEARRASMILGLLAQDGRDLDEEERDKIMAEYKEMTENVKQKMDAEKMMQKQKLLAKLEARKKLKEDIAKEKAVQKQMKAATSASIVVDGTSEEAKAKIQGKLQEIEDEKLMTTSTSPMKNNTVLVQDDEMLEAQVLNCGSTYDFP